MGQIAWWGIIKAGWPVLSILLITSIVTFAVVIEKWKAFGKIHTNPEAFLDSLRKTTDDHRIIAWCEKSDQPLAFITQKIYKAPAQREDKERVLHKAIQSQIHKMEDHISFLGTTASVAPFVGLLGTVIGIIKAFRSVSMSASGGASMVALGIAEALVGTAGGLIVAIPALLFYNYFAHKIRRFVQEWEITGSEIIDHCLATQKG